MSCFVVAGFLLTSASRSPSAIAELLVTRAMLCQHGYYHAVVWFKRPNIHRLHRLQLNEISISEVCSGIACE